MRAGLSWAIMVLRMPVESAIAFCAALEPSNTITATASEGTALSTVHCSPTLTPAELCPPVLYSLETAKAMPATSSAAAAIAIHVDLFPISCKFSNIIGNMKYFPRLECDWQLVVNQLFTQSPRVPQHPGTFAKYLQFS